MSSPSKQTTEFSRVAELNSVRERRRYTAQIEATEAERIALAKRYDVLSVNRLVADITIKPQGSDLFQVAYKIDAEVVQACGVSLVPVTQTIQEADEELLTTDAEALTPLDEATAWDNVPTELIAGDRIDYGEIVAQVIALAIDPFPRAEGAGEIAHIEHETNPFAALQALKPGAKGRRSND